MHIIDKENKKNTMKKLLVFSVLVLSFGFAAMAMATDITVVSDGKTQWSADNSTWNSAVATWVHPSWPSISGATWIWRTAETDAVWEYANVPEGGWYFKKTFEVPQCANMNTITGTLDVDADNSESASINGYLLGTDGTLNKDGPDGYEWSTIKSYPISANLVKGTNTFLFRAMNYFNYGPYTSNPAGLIFKATINYTVGDSDEDGVCDSVDKCSATSIDNPADFSAGAWGVHRWHWDGTNWVQQPNPKGQVTPGKSFTLANTYGCSCKQILDLLKNAGYGEFGGHYKFGCSTSILEDFTKDMNDGVLDGRYFIETVIVPAIKSTDTLSVNPLVLGSNYVLKARGTANAGDNIQFDARYSFRTGSSVAWTDAVSTYEGYGVTLLDLLYNGSTPWGDYNASHEYWANVTGTGSAAPFRIYDVYYPNNTGNLYVDIYAEL